MTEQPNAPTSGDDSTPAEGAPYGAATLDADEPDSDISDDAALEEQIAAELGTDPADDDPADIDAALGDASDDVPTPPDDYLDDSPAPEDDDGAVEVIDADSQPEGTTGVSVLGFLASADPAKIGIKSYTVPGTAVKVAVRSSVAPLLIGYMADYNRLVEPLHPGWCWGYAYRAIRGATTISRHAAGLAVDCNAPKHPLGVVGTLSARQKATMRVLAKKYGLRLGADYTGRKDEMHAEVNLGAAAAVALARKITAAPQRQSLGVKYPALAHLTWRATNTDVGLLIRRLAALGFYKAKVDNTYGPATKAAVAAFQRRQGWRGSDADGLVGPSTYQRLFGRKP
jgi:hypothetical protein